MAHIPLVGILYGVLLKYDVTWARDERAQDKCNARLFIMQLEPSVARVRRVSGGVS